MSAQEQRKCRLCRSVQYVGGGGGGKRKSTLTSVSLLSGAALWWNVVEKLSQCAHFPSSCLLYFYLSDFLHFPEWPAAIVKNQAFVAAAFRASTAFIKHFFPGLFSAICSWQITTEDKIISAVVLFKYESVQKHTWVWVCTYPEHRHGAHQHFKLQSLDFYQVYFWGIFLPFNG